eukprot:TRINITY_DN136768_c0_g1_i1.p1 TRINITY_DN136768_c0_g1~~TRINITY_DN136768_c0_g1_i1.p1  ORF type:complete len:157 (-),score=9.46 TRINITY_DN136768_c0_g1_i1:76-525(-)
MSENEPDGDIKEDNSMDIEENKEKDLSRDKENKVENEEDDEKEKLYCICRGLWDGKSFMVACDYCDEWFHGDCIGITPTLAKKIEQYICPNCSIKLDVIPKEKQRKQLEDTIALTKAKLMEIEEKLNSKNNKKITGVKRNRSYNSEVSI